MTNKQIVLNYFLDNTPFSVKTSFMDCFIHLNECYETVPDKIIDAFEELSEYELWEIIRKVAVEGKQRNR